MWSKTFLLAVGMACAVTAWGAPPNTPVLDGRPLEYDAEDLRASYTGGGGVFGAGNAISNLFVTWDDDYLYIALQGQEVDNKLVVMLDVDPGNGTGATTTTNWSGVAPSFIEYNDVGWRKSDAIGAVDFGLDYQIASEGFFNNIIQILHDGEAVPDTNTVLALFDAGNGASPLGTPVDMAVQSDDSACELKGIEARIPWSVLYPTNGVAADRFGAVLPGETVPRGATLRLFANIHNNNPASAYSANDVIPEQTSINAAWSGGLLETDTYLDVLIDADDDGLPDLAGGDVNAPFIVYSAGVQGTRKVFVGLSEPVSAVHASNTLHWRVGADIPDTVELLDASSALLTVPNDLPAAGTVVLVSATNVQDGVGNQRPVEICLVTSASGLTNALTVRFVLETASGLGVSPGATAFFVNGGAYPLQFGFPPSTSSPLAVLSGTLHYRDVIFPPGTPAQLNYKYSGLLTATGTNTYEAVRLVDFASASRKLTLPLDATSLVVTDHLGAAAGPYRDPSDNAQYVSLYTDAQRGDAGVRQRTTVTFQLDLSGRNRAGISRVILQGSDPLRGFNSDGSVSDWAGSGAVGWNVGGIELLDDGTLGDAVAGDGIYARQWSFSTDGTDSAIVPDFPYSLINGDFSTAPYYATGWIDGRSPRSVIYKFYILKSDTSVLESPASNIELYLEDANATNLVLSPFLWDNEDLPLPPASNAPAMLAPVQLGGGQVRVLFENLTNELQHGVQISTNLAQGWMDFGHRASGSSGNWTMLVQNADGQAEFYRASAGPATPFQGVRIDPFPLDPTGGLLRIYYIQHSRGLVGDRNVHISGVFNSWAADPMTFIGDGVWRYEVLVDNATSSNVMFKPRNLAGTVWEQMTSGIPDNNYIVYKGFGRATWSPISPTNGETLTITYDNSTGKLTNSPTISAWLGYDEFWSDSSSIPMTNIGGTLWQTAITVPTNRTLSVNFVFRNASGTIYDGESDPGGRLNRAFIAPNPYP
ncbi:MAG TPA: hypothetical protein PKE12_14855 [Kiritimatiellia bacterium]|nr:hypothetical protein [Kiritimatiellia bacterium]